MKEFGSEIDGIIISVNEDKLTLNYINQIRNYLTVKEKDIKKLKHED